MTSLSLDALWRSNQNITRVLGKITKKKIEVPVLPHSLPVAEVSTLAKSLAWSKGKKSGQSIFSLPTTYRKTCKRSSDNLLDNRRTGDTVTPVLFQSCDLQASFHQGTLLRPWPCSFPPGLGRHGARGPRCKWPWDRGQRATERPWVMGTGHVSQ